MGRPYTHARVGGANGCRPPPLCVRSHRRSCALRVGRRSPAACAASCQRQRSLCAVCRCSDDLCVGSRCSLRGCRRRRYSAASRGAEKAGWQRQRRSARGGRCHAARPRHAPLCEFSRSARRRDPWAATSGPRPRPSRPASLFPPLPTRVMVASNHASDRIASCACRTPARISPQR
jgi:hypothetical protein